MFFGIVIRMYYRDHAPSHFHAEFQGSHATFTFSGSLVRGDMPSGRARRLIREWANNHHAEQNINWLRAEVGMSLSHIGPLE